MAALLAGISTLFAESASAFCRTTTSGRQPLPTVCPDEGTPLRWSVPCAPVSLDPTLPTGAPPLSTVDDALTRAIAAWNTAACPTAPASPRFTLVPFLPCGDGVRFTRGQPHSNTVSMRGSWADSPLFPPGVIAVTIVSFDVRTGSILDADIALNARTERNPEGYVFSDGPAADPTTRRLSATLTHEMGHLLGLAHSDVPGSIMAARYADLPPRAGLHPDDVSATCEVYPSGSGAGPCDPSRDHACAPACQCLSTVATPTQGPGAIAFLAALVLATLNARRSGRSPRRPSPGSTGPGPRAMG
jgi:hypothetical protein